MKNKMKKNLPKISLITPSYNQAKFIGKTIESVLFQNYSNLEYIILDGGSNDGTLEILKKYGEKIKWESHKDKGQTEAINRGVKMATGEIIGYLNSDDLLESDALNKIASFFNSNPDYYWVTGKCRLIDKNGNLIRSFVTFYKDFLIKHARKNSVLSIVNFISQPATFWRKELVEKIGFFDESLHYAMDYDYWLRISKIYKLGFIDEYLALFRIHPFSKSTANFEKLLGEGYCVAKKQSGFVFSLLHKIHDLGIIAIYKMLRKYER